jgi:hypothetical protein
MAKISFKFNDRFVAYLKSIAARWDPQAKVWVVQETKVLEAEAKAKELDVQKLKIEPGHQQSLLLQSRRRCNKDEKKQRRRFVLISVDLKHLPMTSKKCSTRKRDCTLQSLAT